MNLSVIESLLRYALQICATTVSKIGINHLLAAFALSRIVPQRIGTDDERITQKLNLRQKIGTQNAVQSSQSLGPNVKSAAELHQPNYRA